MDIEKLKSELCSPGWNYNPTTQQLHIMNCKRRACDRCGKFWAWKWRQALAEKVVYNEAMSLPVPTRALTLTFAMDPGCKVVKDCLRYFWQLMRRCYPGVKYFGIVEYNQKHTIPHLHFLLAGEGEDKVDYEFTKAAWQKAQLWAGIPADKIAFNVRLEKIRGSIQTYYTKYITKLTGGKDEIPRRENWQGRFVRYSRASTKGPGFFPAPIPVMATYAQFKRKLEADQELERVVSYVRKPLAGLSGWLEKQDREQDKIDWLLNRPWNWQEQKGRASPVPYDVLEPIYSLVPGLTDRI